MQEDPGEGGQSSEDDAAQRCPICLNRPRQTDRAVPDCCTHVFCSTCILRWAQMVQSCPVDRRRMRVIHLQDSSPQVIKIPVKEPQASELHMCCSPQEETECRVQEPEDMKGQPEKPQTHTCDTSVHKDRKMSGDSCHTLLRSQRFHSSLPSQQGVTLTTVTRMITDSVEVCEELSDVQLTTHAPALFTRLPRVSHHSHLLLSAVSASLSRLFLEPSVCAVTCPAGEERKGSRGSGSKSSTKPAETVTTRRSSRHSRAETEDSTTEQSQTTDSNTSSTISTAPQTLNDTHASTSRDLQENNQRAKTRASPQERDEDEDEEQKTEPENHKKDEELVETRAKWRPCEAQSSDAEAADLEPKLENEMSLDENQHVHDDDNQEEETTTAEKMISQSAAEDEDNQTLSPGGMLENDAMQKKCNKDQAEPFNVHLLNEDSPPSSCDQLQKAQSDSQNGESNLSVASSAELSTDASNVTTELQEPDTTVEVSDDGLKQESGNFPSDTSNFPPQSMCLSDQQLPLVTVETATSQSVDPNTRTTQDQTDLVPMGCGSPALENEERAAATDSSANLPQTPTEDPTEPHKSDSCKELNISGKKEGRRRSRFHSSTTTWSPSRSEASRKSRSPSRDRSGKNRSTSRNRERQEDERDWKRNRSRERSRSREHSRRRCSRSHSTSRTKNQGSRRSPSQEHLVHGGHSPHKRDGWKDKEGGSNFNWRNNSKRTSHLSTKEPNSSDSSKANEPLQSRSENLECVKQSERTWADTNTRGHEPRQENTGSSAESRSWGGWTVQQGQRPVGRGRGAHWSSGQLEEPADNWRQCTSFSGTANNTDLYNHCNENSVKRKEPEGGDLVIDRSGWSSASSWAVRRTLPADVQNYYSRRGRGGGANIWSRQEEDQSVTKQADVPHNGPNAPILSDTVAPVLPVLLPPQLSMLGALRYPPTPLLPRAPSAGLQPPPVPVHLHPAGPLLQEPPPPPPPPPPDSHTSQQVMPSFQVPGRSSLKPMPAKVSAAVSHPAGMPDAAQPSSSARPGSHSTAQADSSKRERKLQIQQRAASEVKAAMKPYYQSNDVSKEEYKEIVRKAVEKVCHSRSGEVNAEKVAKLVKAYVDKYKHTRRNKVEKS